MKVYGVTQPQLTQIATQLDVALFNVRTDPDRNPNLTPLTYFQLRPTQTDTNEYRKVGRSGRRVHAISWEGHRDFFIALFQEYPNAKVVTGLVQRYTTNGRLAGWGVTYNGQQDYLEKYPMTALA
jgi:hypothetical protein